MAESFHRPSVIRVLLFLFAVFLSHLLLELDVIINQTLNLLLGQPGLLVPQTSFPQDLMDLFYLDVHELNHLHDERD